MLRSISLLILMTLISASCSHNRVSSLKDPTHQDKKYQRVLVIGNFASNKVIKEVENQFSRNLNKSGVFALPNYQLLPPLREYSEEEIKTALDKDNFDALIVVTPIANDVTNIHLSQDKSEADPISIIKKSSTRLNTSIDSKIPSKVNTQIMLYDLDKGFAVWKGHTPAYINETTIYDNLTAIISSIIERMQYDGMIAANTE